MAFPSAVGKASIVSVDLMPQPLTLSRLQIDLRWPLGRGEKNVEDVRGRGRRGGAGRGGGATSRKHIAIAC